MHAVPPKACLGMRLQSASWALGKALQRTMDSISQCKRVQASPQSIVDGATVEPRGEGGRRQDCHSCQSERHQNRKVQKSIRDFDASSEDQTHLYRPQRVSEVGSASCASS